ncbi:MAG: lipid-A-disaccharide synthase [Verrucomicrobiales bacterium]|nr:lipid-A-disaccharide synthase [Verrucomicrobiales bacterium]
MRPKSFMLIAGEASGDRLAAELVTALRERVLERDAVSDPAPQPLRTALPPEFFGAGGPRMRAAGVELAFDLTRHSLIGLSGVLRKLLEFRRLFRRLFQLAVQRHPDVIVGVDFSGFNLRFAAAVRRHVRRRADWFHPWNPKLVQFVSPQVWASRPGRAFVLAENCDLLLSIIPFEAAWYAQRVPNLRVEFVGHPLVDQFARLRTAPTETSAPTTSPSGPGAPRILLLPGSRMDEVRRHWPVLLQTLERLRHETPSLQARTVLPDETLAATVRALGTPPAVEIRVGEVLPALLETDLAITKSGTVTLECAVAGVPAVVFYKTSWANYAIAKRLIHVKHLAMPNLLAGETLYPEFVQHTATPENLARAALELLRDNARRDILKTRLANVVASLGPPGATQRAARAILDLLA